MSGEAVPQSVGRDVGNTRARRMSLNYRPRCLPRERSRPGSEKQIWSRFIPKSFAYAQIPLQPMHSALPDRNPALLGAFAVTGNQGRVDIDVAGGECEHLTNAQAGERHEVQQHAITYSWHR